MRLEEKVTQGERTETFFFYFRQTESRALGLGHFTTINHQMFIMKPIMCEGDAVRTFTLGNFIRVMNRDVLHPAHMHIQGATKYFFYHGGTFYVPAGKAVTIFYEW